ncbi:hypothetical protein P170DRAFT_413116 [Aspergillus steynii IBT 23096]|uniref:Uncharacterized protein n=1 Tax=Aspergillus steynii IBT 23096 TaxID=1392250 RepID=A0A2I2G336_9EURO|nr:uncharacterized protein P170DRAFT_413116 [Aspergillus steynii IBT 23096]PLB47289.1 hypothetical protein P170DRAFT_413116 [Aspergillus steynii IBT 23096]
MADEDYPRLNSITHVKFESPHKNSIGHVGWDKSKFKRKSITHEDDEPAFVPDSDDEDNDSDDSIHISQNEKSEVVFDFSTEKARRWTDAINLPDNMFNGAEHDLYVRLSMRGFEPVLPSHWKFDFPTLPVSLFPDPTLGFEPMLQIFASEFYAIKSLGTLFSLGGRVRDCKILRKKPEPLIRHAIKGYIKWAMRDARVCISKDAIPLHAIYAQREGIMETLKRLDRRLRQLVGRYQNALDANSSSRWLSHRNYPILIGFIVSGPTVVILTRNSDPTASESSDSTFMCQFDLGERGQDVWNSLAIAITVMHIRRTMMQLAEDEVAGYRKLMEGEKLDTGPDIDR